jgi:hypothetical protein
MATEHEVDLEGLSDVEATIHFTNPDDVRETLHTFFDDAWTRDSLGDHTTLITGFPIESFADDDDKNEYDDDDDDDDDDDNDDDDELSPIVPRHYRRLYFVDSQILLVTMPGLPHEAFARQFDVRLGMKLDSMNCFEEFLTDGATTRSMINVKNEPDDSWGPFLVPGSSEPAYPTCVLEARVSESSRALARDAKIWLEHEESHVTQVVTVKISRTRPEIVCLVWKKDEQQQQRDTRAHNPTRAIVDQEIHIILEDGRPLADGELCLSFEQLLERRPRPGTGEGDLIFSGRELGRIARVVWIEMGFAVEL